MRFQRTTCVIFVPMIMLMHYRTTVRLNWFLCALFFYRSIKWTCKYFRSAFCQARPCSISIFVTAWRKLAAALTQFCAAHDTRELKIFWDERADWWPQFHFRLSLVPNKDHVSELEWKLTRYKAEAARWLRGQGTCFVCTYKRFIVRFIITLV